jgi:hypothetical protein
VGKFTDRVQKFSLVDWKRFELLAGLFERMSRPLAQSTAGAIKQDAIKRAGWKWWLD